MKQEIVKWQWHQLDHKQIICISLQTYNHASTLSLIFYRPDALPDAQLTVSKHWRQQDVDLSVSQHQLQTSRMWTLLNKLLQGANLHQQSTLKTAHMCAHITVHKCRTQYSTNSSHNLLLSSLLRRCLLQDRVKHWRRSCCITVSPLHAWPWRSFKVIRTATIW